MGMEKAILSGKEHRRSFYGAKAVDAQCRCHGSCEYCRQNRLRHYRKAEISFREQMLAIGEMSYES